MARRKTHIEDCIRLLGDGYDHVHAYLDFYAKKWPPHLYTEYHRKFRHNGQAVERCKEMWGFYAERAAMIHLIRDNELYVLQKPFCWVEVEEIDELYDRVVRNYCVPVVNKKKLDLQEGEQYK